MKRWMWIAFALGASCGKDARQGNKLQNGSGSVVTRDAAVAPDAAAAPAPTAPPPPPTTKSGKGDCKLEYAPLPKRDPNPMCKIDGGTLARQTVKDKMTVTLSPYFIDQFEVTNAQVAHYLNATKADRCSGSRTDAEPCFRVGAGTDADLANARFVIKRPDGTYGVAPGLERLPYNRVSRQGAIEYCAWAGKTLPTDPQWELAARHDPTSNKDYAYPWGDKFDGKRARCSLDICPLAPRDPGRTPAENQPAPVGTYDGTNGFGDGRSPWGVFEMAGNVRELVADCGRTQPWCDSGPFADPAPRPPDDGRCEEITRGGGGNDGEHQLLTTTRGAAIMPGFRCARPAR